MSNFSFHIICTSLGRESLGRLINSFIGQLNDNDLNKMKIKISEFKNNPKISIIMPTFNSNIHFFL